LREIRNIGRNVSGLIGDFTPTIDDAYLHTFERYGDRVETISVKMLHKSEIVVGSELQVESGDPVAHSKSQGPVDREQGQSRSVKGSKDR